MGYEDDMQEYYDTMEYKRLNKTIEDKQMKKYFKTMNTWLTDITQLLTNIFVFAVISGLLFNDPFGTISTISTMLVNLSDNGVAGIVSLAILLMMYKR